MPAMKILVLWMCALAGATEVPTIPRDADPPRQADPSQLPLDIEQPATAAEVDDAVQTLERDHSAQRSALEAEYEERRRELVESPDYKSLSRRERKARVRALKNEFRVREQQMEDEYKSKREEFERAREELE